MQYSESPIPQFINFTIVGDGQVSWSVVNDKKVKEKREEEETEIDFLNGHEDRNDSKVSNIL